MKMARLTLPAVVLATCLLTCAPSARALESQTIENASAQEVVDGMANKFARGVANIATGWLEFPKQIVNTSKEEGVGKGIAVGPLKGIGMTLVRTISGVAETMTFFVSTPGFYDPLIDPPYVWRKE
ncbi:hypothetical protein GMSM_11060 [Geomonas sp. Red276]